MKEKEGGDVCLALKRFTGKRLSIEIERERERERERETERRKEENVEMK